MSLRFTRETGPMAQADKERQSIAQTFGNIPQMEGSFDRFGVFTFEYARVHMNGEWRVRVIQPGLQEYNGAVQIPYWSPALFELDNPEAYQLRFDEHRRAESKLRLVEQATGLERPVPLTDIREINQFGMSRVQTVGRSGFLLTHEPDSSAHDTKYFEWKDNQLVLASQGKDCEARDEGVYVHIDEDGWEGKKVLRLTLQESDYARKDHPNIVVLTLEPKGILPRTFDRPLSFERRVDNYRRQVVFDDIDHAQLGPSL